MNKILWLSPNFNHYKARFLNRLAEKDVNLHILAGEGDQSLGHYEIEDDWDFTLYRLPESKKKFGYSLKAFSFLLKNYKRFQWIMIPREKKNLPLILFSFFLRYGLFRNESTRLFSYNHPFFDNRYKKGYEAKLLQFFYRYYDKTIFYTEASKNKAVERGLISDEKAGWANNTLDSDEINKYYKFTKPDFDHPMILFIGRLIEIKKVDVLFDYYTILKESILKLDKSLSLEIVGDGPLREYVMNHAKQDGNVVYHGSIQDEKILSEIFIRSFFVFVPGLSGLSVNHAFLYGRPYITTKATDYTDAPETDYIISGHNGYILSGSVAENTNLLSSLITDREKLEGLCIEAYETGKLLNIHNWCKQVLKSLKIDKVNDEE